MGLTFSTSNNNDQYESRFIFENHLEKLMHLKILSTQKHGIYEYDNIMRVNYKIKSKVTEERGYNLIFIFKKKGGKYLFRGMTMT